MPDLFSRYLDANGDGTGIKNANGDYSLSEGIFYLAPSDGEVFELSRMLVSAYDTSGMQTQEYGNTSSPLTNGIAIRISNDNGVISDLTDGITIKNNGQWGAFCFDVDVKSWGSGNELLVARWTFAKSGAPMRLDGAVGEKLEIVLNDDLTGLITHYFIVQGLKY